MINEEIKNLLKEVITSWQVLAVTVVLIVYVFLVNYVARIYHRRRRGSSAREAKNDMPEIAEPREAGMITPEDEAFPE